MTAMGTNKLVDRGGIKLIFLYIVVLRVDFVVGGGGFLTQEDFELPRLCTPYFIYILDR